MIGKISIIGSLITCAAANALPAISANADAEMARATPFVAGSTD